MVGVHDLARLAEGGAENADGVKTVGLDFEMNGAERFHDGYVLRYIHSSVNTVTIYVWLHMQRKTDVKPFNLQKLPRFMEGNVRLEFLQFLLAGLDTQ
jgi:hypothetical protein